MAEGFPHRNLFVEPLCNCGQILTAWFWKTSVGDSPSSYCPSRPLRMFSELWLQLCDPDIRPSTRQRIYRATVNLSIGHSEARFAAMISEAKPGHRISHPKLSDTRSGVVTLGYPTSTRRNGKVWVQVSGVF